MKVIKVGKLVEHTNGTIDMEYWNFDCDCCSTIDEAAIKHRSELIRLAKQGKTYKKGD